MEILLQLLAFLVIVLLLFLVCREIVCWYWKINRGMALLEEGVQLLRQLRDAANRAEQDALERRGRGAASGRHLGRR